MRGIASGPLLQERRKPVYRGFPSSCNAKRHVLCVRMQLFNNRFLVSDSQDLRHAAYASTPHTTLQPQNILQGVGVVYRTVHTYTILAHHTLHCKNLENRDTELFRLLDRQSFSGWLSRMTTNYRKYVERITVILQEFVAHTRTTNLKSSVPPVLKRFHACVLNIQTFLLPFEHLCIAKGNVMRMYHVVHSIRKCSNGRKKSVPYRDFPAIRCPIPLTHACFFSMAKGLIA